MCNLINQSNTESIENNQSINSIYLNFKNYE